MRRKPLLYNRIKSYDIARALEQGCGFTTLAGSNRYGQQALWRNTGDREQLCLICDPMIFSNLHEQSRIQYDAFMKTQPSFKRIPYTDVYFIYLGNGKAIAGNNSASLAISGSRMVCKQYEGFIDIPSVLTNMREVLGMDEYKAPKPDRLPRQHRLRLWAIILSGILLAGFAITSYLKTTFAVEPGAAFTNYIVYMFSFAGIPHLIRNIAALIIIGIAITKTLSGPTLWLAFISGGIFAGTVTVLVHQALGNNSATIGASGAIFALLGVYLVTHLSDGGVELAITALLILIVCSIGSGVDWICHFAGFIYGLWFGWVFLQVRIIITTLHTAPAQRITDRENNLSPTLKMRNKTLERW